MLARSTTLVHPNGAELQTPLLVSSFSSKGFRFRKRGNKEYTESFEFLKMTADALTESVLLSAYDLKHFYNVKELRKIRLFPRFTFVDSGGYETSDGFDSSEAYKHPIKKRKWTIVDYKKILNSWPEYYPSIIVSYDHGEERRISLSAQIKRASELFSRYPQSLHDFLIKPEKKGELLNVDQILNSASKLKSFKIIGFTEKELGDSLIERMFNIKKIRESFDKIDIKAPIHIFGNLDPLTTVLYFISGAEIFDGLTWLRFSFHNGKSLYDQNMDAIKGRINQTDSLNKKTSLWENVVYMGNLQSEMRAFLKQVSDDGNSNNAFDNFRFYSDKIKEAAKNLYSK